MAKKNYDAMAASILQKIGGKENISSLTHCITRLRFNLKDESVPDDEEVKAIPGVQGVMRSAGQYQIVIGQDVDKAYNAVVKESGIGVINDLQETEVKEKLTFKSILNNILDKLSGTLTPLIPMLIAGAIFKTIVAICGPDMLNIMSAESDIYRLFTFVGDAAFYFFPVIVGYTASKKFNTNPILGMFLGGIMIHPSFVQLVSEGTAFAVLGIPCSLQSYSATIFPIILSVWVMSYVEKFFNRVIPSTLKTVFAPFLTVLVMLPIALCLLGPAGAFIGNFICSGILALGTAGGIGRILAVALIGALWEFLVISGMHWLLLTMLMTTFANGQIDSLILPGACVAGFAVGGMCLGAALRMKNSNDRSLSLGYTIAQVIGGVTEPGIYGIGFGHKKPFIGMIAGGFVGALYAGITNVAAYNLIPVASFLACLAYSGASTMNFVNGVISAIIGFVVSAVITYLIGIEE